MSARPVKRPTPDLLHWQLADLLRQLARAKLWWAVHDGVGSIE